MLRKILFSSTFLPLSIVSRLRFLTRSYGLGLPLFGFSVLYPAVLNRSRRCSDADSDGHSYEKSAGPRLVGLCISLLYASTH